ncbi:MAG: M61 family metallopeptidase [Bryobacteraceae bacterium]
MRLAVTRRILFSFLLAAGWTAAQNPEPIRYTLRFPAPHTHYVEVEARVPTNARGEIELMMAVWTPGSYLVREFARNVEDVRARTAEGRVLAVEKSRKNRWRVETGGAREVQASYRVYSRAMTVRENWVDDGFALLNGAPTFLTVVGELNRPHDVKVELPPGWKTAMSGMPPAPGGDPHYFRAADFDTLVDSPIVAGNPAVYEFAVDGKKHFLVNVGEEGVWDGPRSAADVEKIVREFRRMWGSLPYDRYLFFNVLTEAGGGLEHKNSTVLMASRWATKTRGAYVGQPFGTPARGGWLNLVSHEFFHVWNVKRLRPVELGPFDYENEVHTKGLWVSEGITSYYAPLGVHRAGLSNQEEFLDQLSKTIEQVQTTPGRLVQPLEVSSYDAWIKFYRADENSPNTAISYYSKGAVVGFLLDAKIRRMTKGAKSLDDVMRLAYERYGGERGFTGEEFRRTAEEVAGESLKPFFRHVLETTEELDYGEALQWFGLRFRPARKNSEPKATLGVVTRQEAGRLVVSQVRRGTPAYAAGINVDDEIIALDEFRVLPSELGLRMEYYKPGDKVSVLISRRDKLMRLEATLRPEPAESWRMEIDPQATKDQKARLSAWLAGR